MVGGEAAWPLHTGDPRTTMYAACWAALALATVAAPDDNSSIIFRSNFTEPHWVA